ncbi:MAG TPA: Ig-like domain-containing protein [Gemmatimonadaceae bacterium]|nr:Ig-like domain-containing protein [Gemmatimonadaceae bacterium]
MRLFRIPLLAAAALWLGCSDTSTEPVQSDLSTLDLPTSLPQNTIEQLKTATAADLTALRAAITALPKNVVHSEGNRTAMLARLSGIESEIARGNIAQAMHHLQNLRKWVDGCSSPTGKAQGNDKLRDCAAQIQIRTLIDSVIDTLVDKLDTTPDVTINQASNQADPTSAEPIRFTVVFSEPVTGFTGSDVSFTGSTATGTLAAAVSGSGENYTVSVTGMTTSGTVRASIPAGAAVDADNNPTLASTSTDNTVQFNSPPPTVTINQTVGQPDPTTGGPISFTVVFNKAVTGFTASDVSFTGSTAGGTLVAAVSGTGPTYTVLVTGMTSNGTVVASIPAGAANDAGNQPNAASTSTDNSVTFTVGSPTVTINQASGQADPTGATTVTFTVQFSEPVTGFTASDISFTGSTATGTLVAAVAGSGAFYTVTVTGMTGSGTIVVTIPAGAAVDADNNPTAASTSTDNTVNWVKP